MDRLFVRLFRVLMRAYPRAWRRRYGDDMLETARERIRSVRQRRGAIGALLLAARECVGVTVAGLESRLAARATHESRPRQRREKRIVVLEIWLKDVRVAVRGLVRQPVLSLFALAALALGVGATVAIFTVYRAVVLRPLPFHEPDRLVTIWETNPERGWRTAQVAAANYLDWREAASSFDDMAAYNDWLDERVLNLDGEVGVVRANEVTGNFFDVLGVPPVAGRLLDDRHTWTGAEPAVVLSHRFWSRRFGGDRASVGKTVELDGIHHRILGVMPSSFVFPFRDVDVWVPVAWQPELRQRVFFRRAHGMRVVGRLAHGVSPAEASEELSAIATRLEAEYPETNDSMGNGLAPLHTWVVGDAEKPLWILMASVSFLLLIACANVSNMLLARASRRRHELAIRGALGGGRAQILSESLTESLLLAFGGGALGLLLGAAAMGPLLAMSPDSLPRFHEIGVDASVAVFALAMSLACGVFFGSVPAWRAANSSLAVSTRGGSASPSRKRASSFLVGAEIALALPLIIGAGLMVRTLMQLSNVDPGFQPANVLVANVMLPSTRYDTSKKISAFYRTLHAELESIGGVASAGMSSRLPFGNQRWSSDFTADGWPADRYGVGVRHDEITPGLFRTLGIPLLRGRDFETADGIGVEPVVIINKALADAHFPGEDPLGRRVAFDRVPDDESVWRTIVGVVGNVRRSRLALEEEPSFYAPVIQDTTRQVYVVVRTERDTEEVFTRIEDRLHSIDPALPLFGRTALAAVVSASMQQERFLVTLLSIAAAVALALACVGIFGVSLYSTLGRTKEIGIRIALGARVRSVVWLVLRGGLEPVVIGTALGLLAAVFLSRAFSGLLFEVHPLDPATFAAVVTLVMAVAFAACVIPARLATRIDPTTTLRDE